jgi:hypothetical protein
MTHISQMDSFCKGCRDYGTLKPVESDTNEILNLCEFCRSQYLAEPVDPLSGLQRLLLAVMLLAFAGCVVLLFKVSIWLAPTVARH